MMTGTLFVILALLQPGAFLVDRIVAIVNGEIITLHDVERAAALLPLSRPDDESEASFHQRVLDELVNCKVIALEYGEEFNLSEEDYAAVQIRILQKSGALEKLTAMLAGLGMSWSDLREFIREKALYEKVLREKFPMDFAIPFSEVEDFYNREYLPSQLRLGLEPRALADMVPQIEIHLRNLSTQTRQAAWLADIRSSYTIAIKPRSQR